MITNASQVKKKKKMEVAYGENVRREDGTSMELIF